MWTGINWNKPNNTPLDLLASDQPTNDVISYRYASAVQLGSLQDRARFIPVFKGGLVSPRTSLGSSPCARYQFFVCRIPQAGFRQLGRCVEITVRIIKACMHAC